MSALKELNDLYKNDPIKFKKDMLEISNKIDKPNEKDILYKDIPFMPQKLKKDGLTIYYGARVINKEITDTKKEAELDFLVGYVLDGTGMLITEDSVVKEANSIVKKHLDLKYK